MVVRGKLNDIIQQRLDAIAVETDKVRSQMPAVLQWQRERLLQRLRMLKLILIRNVWNKK